MKRYKKILSKIIKDLLIVFFLFVGFFQVLFSVYGDLWIGEALKKLVKENYENRFELGYSKLEVKFIFGDVELKNFYLTELIGDNVIGDNYIYLRDFTIEGFGFMRFLYDGRITWKSLSSENPIVKLDLRGEDKDKNKKDFKRFFLESGEFELTDALVEVITEKYHLKLNDVNCFFSNLKVNADAEKGISKKSKVDAMSLDGKGVLVFGRDTVNISLGNFYFNDVDKFLSIRNLDVNHSSRKDFLKGNVNKLEFTDYRNEKLVSEGLISCDSIWLDGLTIAGDYSYLDFLFKRKESTNSKTSLETPLDFKYIEAKNLKFNFVDSTLNQSILLSAPIVNFEGLKPFSPTHTDSAFINVLVDTSYISLNENSFFSTSEINLNSFKSKFSVLDLKYSANDIKLNIPSVTVNSTEYVDMIDGVFDVSLFQIQEPKVSLGLNQLNFNQKNKSDIPIDLIIHKLDLNNGELNLINGKNEFKLDFNIGSRELSFVEGESHPTIDSLNFKISNVFQFNNGYPNKIVDQATYDFPESQLSISPFNFIIDRNNGSKMSFNSFKTGFQLEEKNVLNQLRLKDTFLEDFYLKLNIEKRRKNNESISLKNIDIQNFNIQHGYVEINLVEGKRLNTVSKLKLRDTNVLIESLNLDDKITGNIDVDFKELFYQDKKEGFTIRTDVGEISPKLASLKDVFLSKESSKSGLEGTIRVKKIKLENIDQERFFNKKELFSDKLSVSDFNISGIVNLDSLNFLKATNKKSSENSPFHINELNLNAGYAQLVLKDSLNRYHLSIPNLVFNQKHKANNSIKSELEFNLQIPKLRFFDAEKRMSIESDTINFTSIGGDFSFKNLKIYKPNVEDKNGMTLFFPEVYLSQPQKRNDLFQIDSILLIEPSVILLKNSLKKVESDQSIKILTELGEEIPNLKIKNINVWDADFRSFTTTVDWKTRLSLGLKRDQKKIRTENIDTSIFENDSLFWGESSAQVGKERKKQIVKWFKNYRDTLIVHPVVLKNEYNVWSDLNSGQNLYLQGVNLSSENLNLYSNNQLSFDELHLDSPFFNWVMVSNNYRIGAEDLHISFKNKSFSSRNFAYYTTLSKYDYGKVKGYQTDFLNVGANQVAVSGFDFISFLNDKDIFIDQISLQELNVYAFRDKTIPFDYNIKDKLFIREMLNQVPNRVKIGAVGVSSGQIVYEEYLGSFEKKGSPDFYNIDRQLLKRQGVFTLDSIKIAAYNLTNLDSGGHMRVNFVGRLMNEGKIETNLDMLLGDSLQSFSAKGAIDQMPLEVFNGLIENLYFLRINRGYLNSANFEFLANKYKSEGIMRMSYTDLELEILKVIFRPKFFNIKKRGFLSWVANEIVVRKNNPRYFHFKEGEIYYERDTKRSVFNYWTKSALSGMLSTMINRKRVKLNELEKRKN
ncbi:hypothetical protein [Sediminitomix flava]|uniref:Uncharacterized protein n=1 Tax=Sediminitomix flava TaxID=379075 RepID=A0A315ZYB1_SEDFL|nr:hypothetical protein [Sediminitomix flava]PWJ42347.1 hypothetical protein BC781_103599 [Sediminitomix flava]